ncbi:MAG: hypothetical protein AB7N91_28500 [Candidatus Tectimicrobiota bacterium]
MVQSPTPSLTRTRHATSGESLNILRTETVLSRFPIHNLTKRRRVTINIQRTNAQGELEVRWHVSYNEHYGPPGPLAYKLDTLAINQILDVLPRPLPTVLKLGSQRQISALLDLNDSGRQYAHLKNAFHQNASAYIVAYLRYRGRDGLERTINAGFTRYSVVFTGEYLPDGTTADGVYLVLSEPYREILNHAPVRPLDYTYLKGLPPMAQRFYELLSYKMFAALKYRHTYATLRYAEYCLLSTQQRYTIFEQVQKQMYKVHQPHKQSGYLAQVRYVATTDADGQPDWLLHYTPGPKARAEYAAFMRQPGAPADAALLLPAEAEEAALLAFVTPEVSATRSPPPPLASVASATPSTNEGRDVVPTVQPHPQAAALVQQFYQRFHGLTGVTPAAKELVQATTLLTQHGPALVAFLLTYAHDAAQRTDYQPQTFGGILHYVPRALATYTDRATPVMTPQDESATRRHEEHYLQWRHKALAHFRSTQPPEVLAALAAREEARLIAEGTAPFALGLAVRVAVDTVLEAQAALPTFTEWRRRHDESHAAHDQAIVPEHCDTM